MLIESFIVHTQKLNNQNTVLYLITKELGFIQVFYNKKNYNKTNYKFSKQSILQPFRNLLIELNNKKNQVVSIEENSFRSIIKNNKSIFYKTYINELVYLFYKKYKNDPNSIIFESYKKSLALIDCNSEVINFKIIIHNFENELLKDLGYEINFNIDLNIKNNYFQYNIIDNLFTPIDINKQNLETLGLGDKKLTLKVLLDNLIIPINSIINLSNKIYNNKTDLYAIKIINHKVINHYLENQKIYSYSQIE